MKEIILIVDQDYHDVPWRFQDSIVSFEQFFSSSLPTLRAPYPLILNLCHSYHYMGAGYYCSLLSDAYKVSIMPSINNINDFHHQTLGAMISEYKKIPINLNESANELVFYICLGYTSRSDLQALGTLLFKHHPFPILAIQLLKNNKAIWKIERVFPVALANLPEEEQTFFWQSLANFTENKRKKAKLKKMQLAILYDPTEKKPPSDYSTILKMKSIAEELPLNLELITRNDYYKLPTFDALFIRTNTKVGHYSYRFSRQAQRQSLVVIDDPESIWRCCNKVFLNEILTRNHIPIPKSTILIKSHLEETLDLAVEQIGFPMVLKVPDNCFCRGIVKVDNLSTLKKQIQKLFINTELIIAQEFIYTDYDWRITIFNGRVLFAVRYFMSNNFWKIIEYRRNGEIREGDHETVHIKDVPSFIIETAIKASQLIGDGLYGVDLKQIGKRAVVIEINDNPSIDSGVEDEIAQDSLYINLFSEFIRRIESNTIKEKAPYLRIINNQKLSG